MSIGLMDEEPAAKRRCLTHVKEETFCIGSSPASLQSQPQEGFFKIHHTSILSGLDHSSHVQEEVAYNSVRIDGAHGTNESRRATKADSEICYGMVRHPVFCLESFRKETNNQYLV